jgi:membrane dipeptidase
MDAYDSTPSRSDARAYQDQPTVVAPPSVVTWRTRRPDIFGPLSSFGRQSYPTGIESVVKLPNLTQGLFDRGYSEADTAAILGGNWLRTIRQFCG